MLHTSTPRSLAFLALIVVGGAAPSSLQGQEGDVPVPIPDETLTSYAEAFNEINAIHQVIQEELAAPENKSLEVQAEIRERLTEKVAEVLGTHGLTREQHAQITFMVSTDEDHKDRFIEILERLAGG